MVQNRLTVLNRHRCVWKVLTSNRKETAAVVQLKVMPLDPTTRELSSPKDFGTSARRRYLTVAPAPGNNLLRPWGYNTRFKIAAMIQVNARKGIIGREHKSNAATMRPLFAETL